MIEDKRVAQQTSSIPICISKLFGDRCRGISPVIKRGVLRKCVTWNLFIICTGRCKIESFIMASELRLLVPMDYTLRNARLGRDLSASLSLAAWANPWINGDLFQCKRQTL